MLNSEKIIEGIRDDAPCVYNILHEGLLPDLDTCPQNGTNYEWDQYFLDHPEVTRPTADQLLERLSEYWGVNWVVHYWQWRYAQMLETDEAINQMIAVLEENKKKLAPVMDYEYTMKIDLLKNVQEFITT